MALKNLHLPFCFFFCLSLFKSIEDRKSTRLTSSHVSISYAVFCLTKIKIIAAEPLPALSSGTACRAICLLCLFSYVPPSRGLLRWFFCCDVSCSFLFILTWSP